MNAVALKDGSVTVTLTKREARDLANRGRGDARILGRVSLAILAAKENQP